MKYVHEIELCGKEELDEYLSLFFKEKPTTYHLKEELTKVKENPSNFFLHKMIDVFLQNLDQLEELNENHPLQTGFGQPVPLESKQYYISYKRHNLL